MGAPLSPRNPNSTLSEASVWTLESGLDSGNDLDTHIRQILDFVERKLTVLRQLARDCSLDLFCAYSSESGQGGAILDATLLRRMAVLSLDLVLDLYPPSDRMNRE